MLWGYLVVESDGAYGQREKPQLLLYEAGNCFNIKTKYAARMLQQIQGGNYYGSTTQHAGYEC